MIRIKQRLCSWNFPDFISDLPDFLGGIGSTFDEAKLM
jgi:hypothetical protein